MTLANAAERFIAARSSVAGAGGGEPIARYARFRGVYTGLHGGFFFLAPGRWLHSKLSLGVASFSTKSSLYRMLALAGPAAVYYTSRCGRSDPRCRGPGGAIRAQGGSRDQRHQRVPSRHAQGGGETHQRGKRSLAKLSEAERS